MHLSIYVIYTGCTESYNFLRQIGYITLNSKLAVSRGGAKVIFSYGFLCDSVIILNMSKYSAQTMK